MSSRLVVAGLVVLVSRTAAAQDPTFIPHDHEANAQIAQIVASAEAAGLPTNPIVGKVQYALSVPRAKPAAIVTVARAVAERLEIAREALAPNATAPEIEAGANALAEHATPDALRAVRRASGSRPVVVPLGVLTQLLASKVPLARATEVVTDLIRRNATPNQLVAFGNDVAADVAGMTPEAAITLRARYLIAVLAAPGSGVAAAAADAENLGLPSSFMNGGGGTKNPPPTRPRRP